MNARTQAVAFVACLVASACGGKAAVLETSGRTLQVIQVSTDVAWATAIEASLREQERYTESVDPDETPLAEAQERLAEIRARWQPRFTAFKAVREAHGLAVEAYNAYAAGDLGLSPFLDALDHVLGLYEEIRELVSPEIFEALDEQLGGAS